MLRQISRVAVALTVACFSIFFSMACREIPAAPLHTFLLYPNFRGMMFSDESQVARMAIDINPPANTSISELRVLLEVTDPPEKYFCLIDFPLPRMVSRPST